MTTKSQTIDLRISAGETYLQGCIPSTRIYNVHSGLREDVIMMGARRKLQPNETTPEELMRAFGVDSPDKVRPEQKLWIPRLGSFYVGQARGEGFKRVKPLKADPSRNEFVYGQVSLLRAPTKSGGKKPVFTDYIGNGMGTLKVSTGLRHLRPDEAHKLIADYVEAKFELQPAGFYPNRGADPFSEENDAGVIEGSAEDIVADAVARGEDPEKAKHHAVKAFEYFARAQSFHRMLGLSADEAPPLFTEELLRLGPNAQGFLVDWQVDKATRKPIILEVRSDAAGMIEVSAIGDNMVGRVMDMVVYPKVAENAARRRKRRDAVRQATADQAQAPKA